MPIGYTAELTSASLPFGHACLAFPIYNYFRPLFESGGKVLSLRAFLFATFCGISGPASPGVPAFSYLLYHFSSFVMGCADEPVCTHLVDFPRFSCS